MWTASIKFVDVNGAAGIEVFTRPVVAMTQRGLDYANSELASLYGEPANQKTLDLIQKRFVKTMDSLFLRGEVYRIDFVDYESGKIEPLYETYPLTIVEDDIVTVVHEGKRITGMLKPLNNGYDSYTLAETSRNNVYKTVTFLQPNAIDSGEGL